MHRIFIVVLVLLTFLSESAFTNKTSEFGTLQPAMTIMVRPSHPECCNTNSLESQGTDDFQITLGERYDVGLSHHFLSHQKAQLTFFPPGSFSRGTPLTVVVSTFEFFCFVSADVYQAEVNGTIKSEPGFSPVIDAQWVGVGNVSKPSCPLPLPSPPVYGAYTMLFAKLFCSWDPH